MIKVVLILSVIALFGMENLPVYAQNKIQAEHFSPKHIPAITRPYIQCPQGYSRLFGRNPPTCYENCPQGWTVQSNVTAGAVCVRCPQGWVPSYSGGVSGYWCMRAGGLPPEKPAPGGPWGQP
jgi:hypothetical protein